MLSVGQRADSSQIQEEKQNEDVPRIRRRTPLWVDCPWSISLQCTAVGIVVPVPKTSTLETSRRELPEDVPIGIGTIGTIGTLFIVEQSTLENRPRGLWHTLLLSYTA